MKPSALLVSSPAFGHNTSIPKKYTCQGENASPPIHVGNIPGETSCLVLIVDDPDAPGGTFDHWIVWNIPPTTTIEENSIPGTEGQNHYAITHYKGPCPPSGTHRYFFKVFALNRMLDLTAGSDKHELEKTMQPYILASGELIGLYKKS